MGEGRLALPDVEGFQHVEALDVIIRVAFQIAQVENQIGVPEKALGRNEQKPLVVGGADKGGAVGVGGQLYRDAGNGLPLVLHGDVGEFQAQAVHLIIGGRPGGANPLIAGQGRAFAEGGPLLRVVGNRDSLLGGGQVGMNDIRVGHDRGFLRRGRQGQRRGQHRRRQQQTPLFHVCRPPYNILLKRPEGQH